MLILEFQKSGSDTDFAELYQESSIFIEKVASDFAASRPVIRDDLFSVLNEKLWRWSSSIDTGKIKSAEKVLIEELKKSAIDLLRGRCGTYVKRHKLVDTTAEENAATFESDSDFDLESYVTSKVSGEIKTDQDKRQLIEALTEKSDSVTTAIVTEHLASERPTYASIGQRVGVHYKKVERVIKGLAKNYDASKYGELNAFLSV